MHQLNKKKRKRIAAIIYELLKDIINDGLFRVSFKIHFQKCTAPQTNEI